MHGAGRGCGNSRNETNHPSFANEVNEVRQILTIPGSGTRFSHKAPRCPIVIKYSMMLLGTLTVIGAFALAFRSQDLREISRAAEPAVAGDKGSGLPLLWTREPPVCVSS